MINVGLIGYGRYGKRYYQCIKKNRNFKIIKILRKKKILNNSLFTNKIKSFFKINNIELYIIASSSFTHFNFLKNAINKKKNIIIEKPLVNNIKELSIIKKKLKNFKKIMLVNHTDLYHPGYIHLKKNLKFIGKVKKVKLIYGKMDKYSYLKNKNLPHFEWLPHPIAIIQDLFKKEKFKIKILNYKKITKKFLIQNLNIIYKNNKKKIEIYFSNNLKIPKRNLRIYGQKGDLIYSGYSRIKCKMIKKNNTKLIYSKNLSPMTNLLDIFINKIKDRKIADDRKITIKVLNDLFKINKLIKNFK